MQLLVKPRVVFDRPARAGFAATPTASAIKADCVASILYQVTNCGLPFMMHAAFVMNAALAAQPDLSLTFRGESRRPLALVVFRVPRL
jgi:hypothetical protein